MWVVLTSYCSVCHQDTWTEAGKCILESESSNSLLILQPSGSGLLAGLQFCFYVEFTKAVASFH